MGDLPAVVMVLVVGLMLTAALMRSYSETERSLLWTSFGLHVAAALGSVVIVRAAYGGGDMFSYFKIGEFLSQRLRADFFEWAPRLFEVMLQFAPALPGARIAAGSNTGSMQCLSGFICLLSGDSIYAANLLVACVSFLSKLALFNAIRAGLPGVRSVPIVIGCTLVPSAVFWSSGLLKEPIAMAGLSAMVYGGHLIVHRDRWFTGLLGILFGGVLAGLFKGYLLPPFGIGVAFFFVSRALFASGRTIRLHLVILGVMVALASILITGAALPHFAAEAFESEALDAQAIGQRVRGGSTYSYGEGSLSAQVPLALATVLYRPLVFEASSFLLFANSLETLAAAVLTVVALSRTPLLTTVRYVLVRPTLCFCLGFVLTLAVGVGLTTTNLGTLSRYRMPLVPFYATFLIVLASRRRGEQERATATAPARSLGGGPRALEAPR